MSHPAATERLRSPRLRLVAGVVLVSVFWWTEWHPEGPQLRPGGFFALWLGYILTTDALVAWRTGTSPITRGLARWLTLFAVSIPAWWLFEFLNRFLGNWEYLGLGDYTRLQYFAYSSISFSTVIPAVFTTAELLASTRLPDLFARRARVAASPRILAATVGLGLILLGCVVAVPRVAFPAAWLGVFLVLDPVNRLVGWPSLSERLQAGDWRTLMTVAVAALTCGFFWELWNYYSYPKWVYHVPYLGAGGALEVPRLFEMPLVGYLGYLPFGLELYAIFMFSSGVAGLARAQEETARALLGLIKP